MQVSNAQGSSTEEKFAQEAFKKAYEREICALVQYVREQASSIVEIEELWRLNDFLSARRHDIDGKYDYDYSSLVFAFARLVKEGWIQTSELEGLGADKLAKIAALARM